MPTKKPTIRQNREHFANAGAPSHSVRTMASDPTAPTLEEKLARFDRDGAMTKGEMRLRAHCGANAPLKVTLVWAALGMRRWEIRAEYHPEDHPPVLLGQEALDVFPTDELIATAMLVSQ